LVPPFETAAGVCCRIALFLRDLLLDILKLVGHERIDAAQSGLHVTFKGCKFNSMNVLDMIPAANSAAELMRSLSHPQRLLALCALVDGEKSVAELRQELGIDQVPMSQQLMRLRADGLVEARREGTTVYYSIVRPEIRTVVGALQTAFCPPSRGRKGTR
jgi:DNA-binding transcriptional ArsR family regulator